MGEQISITMQDGFELGAYHGAPSGEQGRGGGDSRDLRCQCAHVKGYAELDQAIAPALLTASNPIFSWGVPKPHERA